jgi:hypothetical protein
MLQAWAKLHGAPAATGAAAAAAALVRCGGGVKGPVALGRRAEFVGVGSLACGVRTWCRNVSTSGLRRVFSASSLASQEVG